LTSHRASGLGWALGVGRVGGIVGPTFGAWVISGASPLGATATAFAGTALLGAVVMVFIPRQARSAPEVDVAVDAAPVALSGERAR